MALKLKHIAKGTSHGIAKLAFENIAKQFSNEEAHLAFNGKDCTLVIPTNNTVRYKEYLYLSIAVGGSKSKQYVTGVLTYLLYTDPKKIKSEYQFDIRVILNLDDLLERDLEVYLTKLLKDYRDFVLPEVSSFVYRDDNQLAIFTDKLISMTNERLTQLGHPCVY